jgi:malonyl CoA-acyl carrier protein transacylase
VRYLWGELGVRRFVEVGPGSVLCGLVRRIAPEAETIALSEPEALEQLTEA